VAGVAGFEPAITGFGDQRPSSRVITPRNYRLYYPSPCLACQPYPRRGRSPGAWLAAPQPFGLTPDAIPRDARPRGSAHRLYEGQRSTVAARERDEKL
jgi:hypothetical protein